MASSVEGSSVAGSPIDGITVAEATEVTPELVEAFARLLPQLSRSATPIGAGELAEIVGSPATRLLLARSAGVGDHSPGGIVGSLTLVLFRIPTGMRAWVEDVVVDQSVRGRGVGEALGREALALATAAGARTVDLTSRASREAANRLYRRLGFNVRETNVYRYEA